MQPKAPPVPELPLALQREPGLSVPPERVHLMLGSKAGLVEPEIRDGERHFDLYRQVSIAEWHERMGL